MSRDKRGIVWYWQAEQNEWRLAQYGCFLDDNATLKDLIADIKAGGRAVSLQENQHPSRPPEGSPSKAEWAGVSWSVGEAPERSLSEFLKW